MKKKIGDVFLQIIPVMIGVYLGFLVSDWSENKQRKHQSGVLIDNLLSEIEANQKYLESVIDYHVMIHDSCRYYSNEGIKIGKPKFFEGTKIEKLASSAYDTGIQTGVINDLSMDKIQAINQVYTFQSDYNEYANLVMANLINKDFSEDEEDLKEIARFLLVVMTDIVNRENGLIRGYETLKEKLNE